MIHPDTELQFIHPAIGFGVVATRAIPKGSITWVQDELDQVFTPQRISSLGSSYADMLGKYSFINRRGEFVLCWDIARYVNHSCEPTCLSAGYNFELAVRDIQPGEQLTDDYATLNLDGSFECHCQSIQCRQIIRGGDIFDRTEIWDGIVRQAFPLIAKVPQPLWELLLEKDAVESALAGDTEIASCKANLLGYHGSHNGL